jgi:hypothetical protein
MKTNLVYESLDEYYNTLNEKKGKKKAKRRNYNKTDYQNIQYADGSKTAGPFTPGGRGKMLKPNFKHL